MTNGSLTIRLASKDILDIDDLISKGYFTSRSDIIRTSVRHYIHELHKMPAFIREMSREADRKRITRDKIVKVAKKTRKQVYKEVYGDD